MFILIILMAVPLILFPFAASADEFFPYSGEKISVEFYETDIESVLRTLSEIGNFNYVLSPEAQGKRVTIVLNDVPWDQVLDLVLRQHGLAKTWEAGAAAGPDNLRVWPLR